MRSYTHCDVTFDISPNAMQYVGSRRVVFDTSWYAWAKRPLIYRRQLCAQALGRWDQRSARLCNRGSDSMKIDKGPVTNWLEWAQRRPRQRRGPLGAHFGTESTHGPNKKTVPESFSLNRNLYCTSQHSLPNSSNAGPATLGGAIEVPILNKTFRDQFSWWLDDLWLA